MVNLENPQRIDEENNKLRNQGTKRDHPHDSITKIDLNTEKSPGDLKRLAVV